MYRLQERPMKKAVLKNMSKVIMDLQPVLTEIAFGDGQISINQKMELIPIIKNLNNLMETFNTFGLGK